MKSPRSVAVVLVVLALVATGCGQAKGKGALRMRHHSVPAPITSPAAPGGAASFTVEGNRIVEADGQQYVPYGFVLWCLSDPDMSSCDSGPTSDSAKITAAADYWHANTVRLQVAWENLFSGPGGSVSASFMTILDSEVALANSLHMVVIITQQTERFDGSLMPDSNSVRFWQYMAGHYQDNPMVMFDLFNEPRLVADPATVWNIWQNGGEVSSPSGGTTTYVGMQELVDTVRAAGADNIIIAEGCQKDHDLSGLPAHALTGSNIAYGTEPSLRTRGQDKDATPEQWEQNWGQLAQTYPIMMEAFIDYPGSDACNPDSPTLFPQLLSYLQQNHLGLLFFSMDPGEAVVGTNLEQPTTFDGSSTFDCSADLATNTAGPGQDLLNWYRAESQPIG